MFQMKFVDVNMVYWVLFSTWKSSKRSSVTEN